MCLISFSPADSIDIQAHAQRVVIVEQEMVNVMPSVIINTRLSVSWIFLCDAGNNIPLLNLEFRRHHHVRNTSYINDTQDRASVPFVWPLAKSQPWHGEKHARILKLVLFGATL